MNTSTGIDVTLRRREAGFHSEPAWRKIGERLRSALRRNRKRSEIHEAVWLLSTIPAGPEVLLAFSKLKLPDLTQRFALLRVSERPAHPIFNPLHTVSEESLRKVSRFLRDHRLQQSFFKDLLPTQSIPKGMPPLAFVGHALEATFPGLFSPVLIQAARGCYEIGQPSEIDFGLTNGWISRKGSRRPRVAARFRRFFRIIESLKGSTRKSRKEARAFIDELREVAAEPCDPLEREALDFMFSFLDANISGKKTPNYLSSIRYLEEVPYLMTLLLGDIPTPKYLYPEQWTALNLLKDEGLFPVEVAVLRKTCKHAQSRIDQQLVGLKAARAWFKFKKGKPALDDFARCALQIIVIVLFAGRRYRCLKELRPVDILVDEDRAEAWIGSTKVKEIGASPFQISNVLPDDDLEFLIAWRQSTVDTDLEFRSLVAIALGLTDEEIARKRNWHATMVAALTAEMGREQVVNTHDPRRIFASWVLVRYLIEEHPGLIDHALVIENIPSEYLSASARARFRELMAAKQLDGPLKMAASLMGNLRTQQLRYTYCRSWPVAMALLSEVLQKAA